MVFSGESKREKECGNYSSIEGSACLTGSSLHNDLSDNSNSITSRLARIFL